MIRSPLVIVVVIGWVGNAGPVPTALRAEANGTEPFLRSVAAD
jgi:hypothetical protein